MNDFHAVAQEEIATKGGEVTLRPDELEVQAGLAASRFTTAGAGVALGYAHVWGGWALGLGLAGTTGTGATGAEDVRFSSLGASAMLERRWRAGLWTARVGAGGELDVDWQTLERTDAARVAAAGYPTTQSFSALAPGPAALVERSASTSGANVWAEAIGAGRRALSGAERRGRPAVDLRRRPGAQVVVLTLLRRMSRKASRVRGGRNAAAG